MEDEVRSYLRPGERICWQGKPAPFLLLEQGAREQILRKWVLALAGAAGVLAVYLTANGSWNLGFVGLVILAVAAVIVSPFTEAKSLRACHYWLTDQRAILMTRDKTFYFMDLSDIDEYQVVERAGGEKCLVLGGELFPEIHKQLRWRACHPKMDLRENEEEDRAQGMIFYEIPDADAVAELLEQRRQARIA